MASRHEVQQQNRDDAVTRGVKPKNMAAAEGKNRRALGDIGNLVTVRGVDGKALPQVNRPVTRSFCAQLLAKAQAAAAAENKCVHKPVTTINADGQIAAGGRIAAAPKAAAPQRKVAVKTKPENVIEISPDTSEKEQKPVNKNASTKKKSQTFTSTLTARSKVACGLTTDKPKEKIVDIDVADVNNELAVVEYVEDMYRFYKEAENESRVHDYMDSQPEINERMRAILIDWLIEVHNKFELTPETLYLTINIVDRYLAVMTVSRKELQLVGISAMVMASKYEEIWAPEVNDFVCISDRAYTNQQVLIMEKRILGELEWTLTVPTPYVFLVRFIKASIPDSHDMENMTYFLAELGLMNYATIMYCPSMVAASAVYASRCTLGKTPAWNETLKHHTGFSEPQLMDCAKLLAGFHYMAAADSKLRVVYTKYSSSGRGAIALLPPAKSLLAAAAAPPPSSS